MEPMSDTPPLAVMDDTDLEFVVGNTVASLTQNSDGDLEITFTFGAAALTSGLGWNQCSGSST
jgi:hypothetical protein